MMMMMMMMMIPISAVFKIAIRYRLPTHD